MYSMMKRKEKKTKNPKNTNKAMLPWPSARKLGLEYSSEAKERRGTEVGGCEGEDVSVCVSITSLLL